MKVNKLSIHETIESARKLLSEDQQLSSSVKAIIQLLITMITLLSGRLFLTRHNSSKPPSTDPNPDKNRLQPQENNMKRKPGGQPNREGIYLKPVNDPDNIISLSVDQSKLPQMPQSEYRDVGFEARQVIDIEIIRVITEYRAQILEDTKGNRLIASFPKNVTQPIQYGQSIKSHAVYLSQYQLLPYERTADYFANEVNIPISVGSLFNFLTSDRNFKKPLNYNQLQFPRHNKTAS